MANKHKIPRFSARELEILAMLWQHGALTLAEAHAAFGQFGPPIGYTTMQTRLNRLVDKGAVTRDSKRPAKYEAAVSAEDVGARHMDVLLDKVSGGSVVPLVAHLISSGSLSSKEIKQLKRLIAEAEGAGRKTDRREGKR